jgi:hypothetical protein
MLQQAFFRITLALVVAAASGALVAPALAWLLQRFGPVPSASMNSESSTLIVNVPNPAPNEAIYSGVFVHANTSVIFVSPKPAVKLVNAHA